MEYIIYCDESGSKGPKYSDFFGGCIVNSKDERSVIDALKARKDQLNLRGEIKWVKVTEQYLDRYIEMMDLFFTFIRDGKVKMRIMFRRNEDLPSSGVAHHSNDEKYFKLYYQFIKHGFGLRKISSREEPVYVRIYFDQLPDKKEKCDRFKRFIRELPNISDYHDVQNQLYIREGDVTEVRSHDHVLLQCVDIVLGAMYFRLNELHKERPAGSHKRGKRTIAKEKLYKHINVQIRKIIPDFNIGISTGSRGYHNPDWELPYSHWRFIPY